MSTHKGARGTSRAADRGPALPRPQAEHLAEPGDAVGGRRAGHVVDRALDYAALARGGRRGSDIARQRRRSKAYVSILLRLGRALGECSPEELAALRSPRITWKLVQGLVRTEISDVVIRTRLRQALGGFSSLTVDRRRHRKGRPGTTDPLRAPAGTYVWQWDAGWAARDPIGYVEAYRAFLSRLQRDVTARLRAQAHAASTPGTPLAGQSLRQLSSSLTRGAAHGAGRITAEGRQALTLLAELDQFLGLHRGSAGDDLE